MAVIVALNVISSGQAPIGEAGSALTVTPVTWMGCADGRAVGLAATDVGEADDPCDGLVEGTPDGTSLGPEPVGWAGPAEPQPAATTETVAITMAIRRLSMLVSPQADPPGSASLTGRPAMVAVTPVSASRQSSCGTPPAPAWPSDASEGWGGPGHD